MSADAISVEALSHWYGPVEIFRNLDLTAKAGEFVAVVGPSGCGKTTLLNLLSGFERPTSGRVRCSGLLRMVYQHDGLYPWLTTSQNIAIGLRAIADDKERARLAEEWLDLIGLSEFGGHYPHQISGGMRQRVELARALGGKADILLMDEPLSALDYLSRIQMRHELMRVLSLRPVTVLFVTHDVEEAVLLADRVVVLSPRPAAIRRELLFDVPQPRDLGQPAVLSGFQDILKELEMTERPAEAKEQQG